MLKGDETDIYGSIYSPVGSRSLLIKPCTLLVKFDFFFLCIIILHISTDTVIAGQLENTETRERKREREREGTPKTEVNIFDRAAHKAIVF